MLNLALHILPTGAADEDVSDLFSNISDVSYMSDIDNLSNAIQYDLSNGSPLDKDKFKLVHYNINSITAENRIDTILQVHRTINISVLVFTESKLDDSIPNNVIHLPGFHEPIRRDRETNGRYGGGCLIYISENLAFKHQINKQVNLFEHIWVDVKIGGKTIAINCFYRPPNETADDYDLFLNTSETILKNLSDYNADLKVIASDLNFGNCYCTEPILQFKPLDHKAPQLFASYGLNQLIDIPTRTCQTTVSLIDLLFVDSMELIEEYGTLPEIADHDGILLCLNLNQCQKKSTQKVIFDYKNADIDEMKKFFTDFNFQNAVFNLPVSEQTDAYSDALTTLFKKCVPTKTVFIKPQSIPWCNKYTRLLLRKKNRNYKIFKQSTEKHLKAIYEKDSYENLTILLNRKEKANKNYKIASKESTKANRRAKNTFFNSVNSTMQNFNISAKKKFNILTKLMNNGKYSTIASLIENGKVIENPTGKSEILNTFFANKASVQGADDDVPHLDKIQNVPEFDKINTSPIEVAKLIRNLKQSSSSHCGIPGKFLALISTPISFSLSRILNNLFENGLFPDIWKISHVTAIFKQKGLKSEKSNYRPISLLPTLSKVFESVAHKRLLDHCLENKLISDKQAAYLKGDSTIHQLLYIVDKIKRQWTKGDITHGIFLDVQSAFEKVWHKGLIAKLNQINVTGNALEFFSSYLTNRKQITVVDGEKSTEQAIKAGVPQGSRLGPLLFIIYINDITENIESDILIFADDTTLLASAKTPTETTEILNRDLEKLSCWSKMWKVSFNADKSEQMIFSKKVMHSPDIIFNGENIKKVTVHKHLGLHLTYNLDWGIQIHQVCMKANRKLSVLRRVKLLSRHTLDILYKLTIRSTIDYALPVYYNSLKVTEKAKLDKVQYNAAKLVSGALHLTNASKLNNELSWETIQTRAEFLGLSIFHKITRAETRPLIRNCLQPRIFNQQTLRSGNYVQFKYSGLSFANSFFPHFTKQWNQLGEAVRQLSTEDFKKHLSITMKPHKIKHFAYGSKIGNRLLTQIRVGRSYLNAHSYTIGRNTTNNCSCNAKSETSLHYITQCPLYAEKRQTLYDQVEQQFIPSFRRISLKRQYEILVYGYEPDNPEMKKINSKIMILTQKFILNSKRFTTK